MYRLERDQYSNWLEAREFDRGYTLEMFRVDINNYLDSSLHEYRAEHKTIRYLVGIGFTPADAFQKLYSYANYKQLYDFGFYAGDAVEWVARRVLARNFKPVRKRRLQTVVTDGDKISE